MNRIAAISHALAEVVSAWLWRPAVESEIWLARFSRRVSQIAFAVIRDLADGQLSLRAMGLVFITIVGFFPALTLVLAVLRWFGVHEDLRPSLLDVFAPLGEQGIEVTDNIIDYINDLHVQFINLTSVVILLYLLVNMLRKIEACFNYIWCVENPGLSLRRLLGYLLTILLIPALHLLSIGMSTAVKAPVLRNWIEEITFGSQIPAAIFFLFPLASMSLGFTLMYLLIPATRVRFGSALIGGIVTALVWKLLGSVFQGVFVSPARDSIYLAFASTIAVMYFVYFGWLVALIGSNVAYYHQYPERIRSGR